jgi:hypothetical protein
MSPDRPVDNQIVVATRSGNILVGRCDLADFHVRTKWGTMTIDNSRVITICCKSCGLKRLVQSTSAEGWMLMPLQFRSVTMEVQGETRQAAFAPQQRLQIRPENLSR